MSISCSLRPHMIDMVREMYFNKEDRSYPDIGNMSLLVMKEAFHKYVMF